MNVFICVDDHNGTFFNNRRQSRDRVLTDYMLDCCRGKPLYMRPYSVKLFDPADAAAIVADENYMALAGPEDFCFAEGESLSPFEDSIGSLILCKWNRSYPADRKLDIDLNSNGWHCVRSEEFTGSSHEKITVEEYHR